MTLLRLIIALAAALLPGSAALSQTNRMERADTIAHSYNLNPVVVTGSGHHQRLKSTPTPVRVLSSQEISEQGIATFDQALTRTLPQVSMAPNAMGTFLRMNGLGNKYILILVNGRKLSGDISSNVDLNRINMARVKRIEVLDGAASSLYGSDAIAGVINIITDQPTTQLVSVTSNTRISLPDAWTQSVCLDIHKNGFGCYTSFNHDMSDWYQNGGAPYVSGHRSEILGQKFTYAPNRHLALNVGIDYSYKTTRRPDNRIDYEMRYKGLRWNLGGIYKLTSRNSLQASFTVDRFRYGKEYDVTTKTNEAGNYVQSKKQRMTDGELKAILGLTPNSTTIVGADWRKDFLMATSGNIDRHAYTLAAYAQHEMLIAGNLTMTMGLRLTHHETFSNHLTPKVTLMYAPSNFHFRATYSTGFRAPGLDELYYHYFSVNRGKAQISFGNQNLKPEKSHYLALNAEYRSQSVAVSLTGYINRINDMVARQNIPVDAASLDMLQHEFPEMTGEQASQLVQYALYQNSDKGDVKGMQVNVSANIHLPSAIFHQPSSINLSANYAYTYAYALSPSNQVSGFRFQVSRCKVHQPSALSPQPLERSIRHAATIAANYHQSWGKYALNINLSGRLQSKTYYPGYEDAPGFGIWNLHTTHSFDVAKWCYVEPAIGIDNIFGKADNRQDDKLRKYALYTPGRTLVIGMKVRFKK